MQEPKRMSLSSYLMLSVALVLAGLFLLRQLSEISDYLTPLLALVALVMATLNVVNAGVRMNDRLSVVWFSFMLTLVFWFLFEVASSIYPLVLGIPTPYMSFADVLGLAGYFPVMFGLLLLVWPFKEVYASKKLGGVLLLVLILSTVLIVISLMMFPHRFVNLAYVILDIFALIIAIPALVIFLKGTFWRPLLFLVAGLILALEAQIIFQVAALNGTYYPGDLSDLIYDWAFLSAILGFYLRRKQVLTKSI